MNTFRTFCTKCGSEIAGNKRFCTKCGFQLPPMPPPAPNVNPALQYAPQAQYAAAIPAPSPMQMNYPAPARLQDDISIMQKNLELATMDNKLKSFAFISIVFGFFAIWAGILHAGVNPLNYILVGIGVFLMAEGFIIHTRPTPVGLLLNAIGFIVVGAWNVVISILNMLAGHFSVFWLGIGVVQFVIAAKRINVYMRLKDQPAQNNPAVLEAKNLVNSIRKAKTTSSPDIIVLSTANAIDKAIWKVKLMDRSALFVHSAGSRAVVERKENVNINSPQADTNKKQLKMKASAGSLALAGTIPAGDYARFMAWKLKR